MTRVPNIAARRGEARVGDRRSDRGRWGGGAAAGGAGADACLPASLAALPFPSVPTGHDGRWMDADGIPLSLPCRGGPQKGQPAATSAGPPPRLPSVRSRMNGRAALKRRALASAWLPPPGWRAGPARAGCGVGGLLTSGAAGSRTMRDGRLGRRGRSASGKSELLRPPGGSQFQRRKRWRLGRTGDRPPPLLQERPPLLLDSPTLSFTGLI